ncbi:branched-chain amino acid transport system II carrier protein [Dermatophilus congolensis]|uniref:LIV-II n=1 Tax=Dermatophilus congolensis TaxID=1863 RepID=A0A239V3J9_9MICO|nr:branched-chain amino acid transport system II carrier protein [Dermatophilus congolensis]MBO3130108.1 branched-chain amino acid transport system II carrier protein [Dermatophilus congolensis]MBO3131265.1 branched-chain amino acid transport system II carrier protein [Dermatophilus congolensis]MBO3134579.1 branched-chain amino acid transport system II carrier protein [Dermatophilus congolensis]MBO3136816.1 branched-chain amino acid transport system II carrier protein [Dermatophilus congolensis
MPPTNQPSRSLSTGNSLLVGSLLFGLFFGAGNLIFPVQLGRDAAGATPAATAGFLITAVGLPIIGVIASALSRSSSMLQMTSNVSRWYAVAFTCALYLTIGPLFAVPRTATVSFEVGFASYLPEGSEHLWLAVFTIVFFTLTGLAAIRPGRLIDWVGRYLTPVFLVLLLAVIAAAVIFPMGPVEGAPNEKYAQNAAAVGFIDGYATMDALASLAFAIVIIEAIHRLGVTSPGRVAAETAKAGIYSMIAMTVIYAALAYIGATSLHLLPTAKNGGTVLAAVSSHYFGPAGTVLIAAIVLAACLKTSIGLVTACAEMFSTMFPTVLGHKGWTILFTVFSAGVANIGLASIVKISVPVLLFLYPLAITAIILGLLTPWLEGRALAAQLMTAFTAVAALFDMIKALEFPIPGKDALVNFASAVLPGYDLGFGWALPALVGLAAGFAITHFRSAPPVAAA